ncbi:MAG: type II toxin-antitoxin system RelE/ParE family toxin [Mesorhizobium sp.]|nr:type II toxin-antitoxin system RelE/ParE family toxin [Mesorhizobium sp.]
MTTVVWSDDALDDLDALLRHVAQDRPKGALALADRIDEAVSGLAEFATGRQGRVAGCYEKVVGRTPYIVAYALTDNRITILRVIHGSRDWPEGKWPEE